MVEFIFTLGIMALVFCVTATVVSLVSGIVLMGFRKLAKQGN